MKKLLWIFFCCASFLKFGWAANPKTVMLVLGSADPKVLEERVAVAARLYKTQLIDRIIVSGGCGAHGSGICEATVMELGLIANGVEGRKIYKEENAKTTVQNYVFSRVLRDEKDEKIIQPGDTVFVVSNHWHAIPVAARLQQYDQVVAKFYIEGALIPKETDKLDYVGIFNGQPDNDKFVLKGSWLTPDAVWSRKDTAYYLTNGLVYGTDKDNHSFVLKEDKEALPFLKELNMKYSKAFIDGGKYWWVRNGNSLLKVEKGSNKIVERRTWSGWIKDMPEAWKTLTFTTGAFWNNSLLIFANDKILVAKVSKGNLQFVEEKSADAYFINWPFSWGKSNVAMATIDPVSGNLLLYRNMEMLKVDKGLSVMEKPEPFKLKWIEE